MRDVSDYRSLFIGYLDQQLQLKEPENLYNPIKYIMHLGGKRMRPVLTLLSAEAFGSRAEEALPAALAVEIFHNFSLVHDDIMDDAPLRRGMPTVHEKWDINTGILSGDAMLILAYQLFEQYPPQQFIALAKLFSKTALEVCEGQQYDVDFAQLPEVSTEEYLRMISYKTAVLLGAALEMGAIIANAGADAQRGIYDFGLNLGIAFQLMDDYLDVFGSPEEFGKQPGGDILENKKTYLYLQTAALLEAADLNTLFYWYAQKDGKEEEKIAEVKALMIKSGADKETLKAISTYTEKALDLLNILPINEHSKELLRQFARSLQERKV